MTINDIINAFCILGNDIREGLFAEPYRTMMNRAEVENPWFLQSMQRTALNNLCHLLNDKNLVANELIAHGFQLNTAIEQNKNILIVCAGNIPAVAFHDIMCVLLSGCNAVIKLSSRDKTIIPFLLERLTLILPEIKSKIRYTSPDTLNNKNNIHGVIATGSDSSSLVFEQYFSNTKHIIRKSRHSVAIITENDDISGLEDDICLYFSQGCRSVSHLFVPQNYDFTFLSKSLLRYSDIINHNKYRNNYDYQKAIMIMNNIAFIEAIPILLRENEELYSPVAVVNYSYYNSVEDLATIIEQQKDTLQCVAMNGKLNVNGVSFVGFGSCQKPIFTDYAYGVNTMDWLKGV